MLADWECRINHVYKEGNKLVDGLASMGQSMVNGNVFFDSPPGEIFPLFEADLKGMQCFRQVSVPFIP